MGYDRDLLDRPSGNLMMTDLERRLKEAREDGKRDAEKEHAKFVLKCHLIKHLLWFAFGCFIGGGAAIEGGEPFGTVIIWACITGFVVSFIKWILFGIILAILGC